MLELKNLNVEMEKKLILDNLNFKIETGTLHVLMGPNGSGKSTIANLIIGKIQTKAIGGEIIFENQNILELSPEIRSKLGVFLAYQNPVDLPGIAPISFLKAIYNAHQEYKNLPKVESSTFLEIIRSIRQEYNFDFNFLERGFVDGMSGGEKKMFEILQILILDPKLIILDEIDSGLDIDKIKLVAEILQKFRTKAKSFLVITHNPKVVYNFQADFVHIMKNGKILESGGDEIAEKIQKYGFDD